MTAKLPGDMGPLLRRLWRDWVRRHRGTIAFVLVFIATGAAANAAYPIIIGRALDLLKAEDWAALSYAPIVVIIATAARGGSLFMQVFLTNRFVTRVEADLQIALYGRLLDQDVAQIRAESGASLTQRFTTDFLYIKEALTRLFTVFIRDIATLLALVAVLLWIDWRTTLLASIVAPFVVPPIARIGRRLRTIARTTQEQTGTMAAAVAESLSAAPTAKAYRLEDHLKQRGFATFEEIRALKLKAANMRARMDPILEIAAGLAIAGVILFVGWRIRSGETTLGDFTQYTTALLMAVQPVRTLGNLNAIVQEAMAALSRTFDLLDRTPTITDRPGAPPLSVREATVRFDNVHFRYGEGAPGLQEVSFVAEGGRTTAIVGPSGAGKSTILALLPRLYDVEHGTITIDGTDIRSVTLASLRERVAVVAQDNTLLDDTIAANIAHGRPGAERAAIEAAARAAFADGFIREMPEGYDTRVGERGTRLSGGERQRIALARAFLKDAPILVLDEATSALDARAEAAIQEALARLMEGRTTIVVAHRLQTIRNAHHIVVLDQGRVVEQGSHDALIAGNGLYQRLCAQQNTVA